MKISKPFAWNHISTSKGTYWTWNCDKCGESSIERFKLCLTCLKGKRPERPVGEEYTKRKLKAAPDFVIDPKRARNGRHIDYNKAD